MSLKEIREEIVQELTQNSDHKWFELVENTNPANYGVEEINISVDYYDIFANMQQKSFTLKNTEIQFSVRLMGSNKKKGSDKYASFVLSGNGNFTIDDKTKKMAIVELFTEEELELF